MWVMAAADRALQGHRHARQVTLDPNKRYYISILPGDAADPGHGMGGAQIGAGQKTVNVTV